MSSFKIIGLPVLENFFLKALTIYGHGGHLGHVTWIIYTNFGSPFPRGAQHKIWLSLAKRVQRGRFLKMVDGPTPPMDGCWLDRYNTLRVQSHIEIRLPSRTTLFKAPPPSVSGD